MYQADIPMRMSVVNLCYILLTSLPDSHDHEGDRYQNFR